MNSLSQNLKVYSRPHIVASYANESGLQACEAYVFEKYVKSGGTILDIGVGGGRTTPYLSDKAAKYIGLDYSQPMIDVCCRKFPSLKFYCSKASDLSRFENASFDVVVFSFNGVDYDADDARIACFREVFRVLRPSGYFIFSSHNAKALGFWPMLQDASRLRRACRLLKSVYRSILHNVNGRGWGSQAFRNGSGYILDPTHGGLHTFVSTPEFVRKEVGAIGFSVAEVVSSTYPSRIPLYLTPYYYYVLVKP